MSIMSRSKTILVVDDDVGILRMAREALTAMDCIVDTTPSPEYAFELVLKKPYDLLIFDLTMPELSGATLYSLIRTLFRVALPDDRTLPPMILMSGAAANRRAQELLHEPGVRTFIPKPFTIERFSKTVAQVLAT
jgi:CheY-like chemotaxis protein